MHTRLFELGAPGRSRAPTAGRAAAGHAEADLDLALAWFDAFHGRRGRAGRPRRRATKRRDGRPRRPCCAADRAAAGSSFWEDDGRAGAPDRRQRPGVRRRPGSGRSTRPGSTGDAGYAERRRRASCLGSSSTRATRPCLFTDQANPTSNGVYEAIGYRAGRRHGQPAGRPLPAAIRRLVATMSETPAPARAATYAEAERALLARWPETRLEPSLDRIAAFTELLGEPAAHLPGRAPDRHQRQDQHLADDRHAGPRDRPAHRPVHQPARRVDDRADLARRRAADRGAVPRGLPRRRARSRDLADAGRRPPAVVLRDGRRDGLRDLRRRARSTSAVVEVGMGGSWDATNVADATVAVITADRRRPQRLPRHPAGRHRRREGRDHQARLDRGRAPCRPTTWRR